MNGKQRIRGRGLATIGISVFAVTATAFGFHAGRAASGVDVETMLNVSVSIETMSHVSIDRFGDSVWRAGAGSGFLVSRAPCHVWTNHHVVDGAAVIRVQPRGDAPSMQARLVASTARPDIAVLELDRCDGIEVARMGNSHALAVGEPVFAVGNPFGRHPDSVSSGILSHLERLNADAVPYLQTDASINPGNSGGALFNAAGEVVGINTAIARGEKGASASGIGYALPIALARETVASLGRDGERGWGDAGLGSALSTLTAREARLFGLHDARASLILTTPVASGPGAERLQRHDIIASIDGMPVSTPRDFARHAARRAPGETAVLGVFRAGEWHDVELELADGRASETDSDDAEAGSYDGFLGMTLETWQGRDEEVGHIGAPVIARVHDLGPAHIAGIQSAQRGVRRKGPYLMPAQLTATTITGAIRNGRYTEIGSIDEAEALGREVFEAGESLLIEVELWAREKDGGAKALASRGRALYALSPRPATTLVAAAGDGTTLATQH